MQTIQHTLEQSLSERRNQKKNFQLSKINKKETKKYYNLWDIANAVLKWKFIAINVYI
jgi:hypothetical protein